MKISKYMFSFAGLAGLLALLATSCSKSESQSNRHWVRAAPTSAAHTGYIVETPDRNGIEKLLESTGGTARILDAQDGRYELFNISAATISAALPAARVRKNVFNATGFSARPAFYNSLQDANDDNKALGCREALGPSEQFQLEVGLLNHQQEFHDHNGVLSSPDPSVTFAVKTSATTVLWRVGGPSGLSANGHLFHGTTLTFDANLPGEYFVMAKAITASGLCSESIVPFGVTWPKVPYLGPVSAPTPPVSAYQVFDQLRVVDAQDAWKTTKGENVKIAILDTGVNYNHPDLRPNIAMKPSELGGNGLDNDSNGFINDAYGWDFVYGDNLPYDDNGHGTHVAGIAAGALSGIAPHATILPVKVANAMGQVDAASVESGIYYAVKNGANVINLSLGGSGDFLKILEDSIRFAGLHGVLVAVAAMNDGRDNDTIAVYPANFSGADNVIAVAATTLTGGLTNYSDFGAKTVTLAAPGGDDDDKAAGIWGPDFRNAANDGYVRMSGTSMATPVVVGVAALVKSTNPALSPARIKEVLTRTGMPSAKLAGKLQTPAVVNAVGAVEQARAR